MFNWFIFCRVLRDKGEGCKGGKEGGRRKGEERERGEGGREGQREDRQSGDGRQREGETKWVQEI